ncbi:M28 family peptidase [Xanthovirga aplysinae]|uniref:M28 family peptidase n=1 Tax=Xanthovirga aplysinae TaxID=2529853 RepID=UPI0012BCA410|nr:M28 family peptidase [Xanthovirga aplysinae]MTI31044.1 M28 family peptidase [Xanthovirga aplysinae]
MNKKNTQITSLYFIVFILILASCGKKKPGNQETKVSEEVKKVINVPAFNADSAYEFVKKQVDFGPRVPNSAAHRACGDYLIETLKKFGAKVKVQEFDANAYDGTKLFLRNIIGSFNPEKKRRILLAAHWDTRHVADKDEINPDQPIDGANDGASGVGVLLEIARAIHSNQAPDVGIDIIFFDGEDYGVPNSYRGPISGGTTWCLGSQYWAKNKHESNYTAYYGILLDMVGAKGAQFYREGYSMEYAPNIVDKVWKEAASLGYGQFFVPINTVEITDDHQFVNQAGIPMIDIIPYDPSSPDGFFPDYHHRHKDNMDIIDKTTLAAVGETVLHTIYKE